MSRTLPQRVQMRSDKQKDWFELVDRLLPCRKVLQKRSAAPQKRLPFPCLCRRLTPGGRMSPPSRTGRQTGRAVRVCAAVDETVILLALSLHRY